MRPPVLIESPQNPRFRLWDSLQDGRGIRKAGRFLLGGQKTVPEALARWPDRFEAVLGWEGDCLDRLGEAARELDRVVLARDLFRRLDVSGTGFPLLVGRVPDMSMAALDRPPQGLELVCALGDPGNLGALLRSAAAFGVSTVVLLQDSAHPFHPKCLRGASNAAFTLDLRRGPGWDGLKGAVGPLLALDAGGADLARFDWPADARLVLGEEGLGVPADLPATRLTIPTSGAVESLNATVAASIALFSHFLRKSG